MRLAALYMIERPYGPRTRQIQRLPGRRFHEKAVRCHSGHGSHDCSERFHQSPGHTSDQQIRCIFIGRGLDYAFSLEGALKLKEISYIHAEAYATGELKHGTIALITEEVPVIAIATQEKVFAKTISNIREVKARGAFVILITREDAVLDGGIADIHIRIPKIGDRFTVFPIAVVLQLIAYYASTGKNLDVDQPRNLAKSVTVE